MATKGKAKVDAKSNEAPKDLGVASAEARQSAQDANFASARETAVKNHEADVQQNISGGYDGVEVREGKTVEVINPVRNPISGELESDTRVVEQTDEEVVGATSAEDSSEAK